MKIKRVRRGCYDKFHRCPGWAGGGWRFPKADKTVCKNGSIVDAYEHKWWFKTCNKGCGTLVLPYFTRWLDPTWIRHVISRAVNDWRYNRDR